ncbi:MAG TPA: hypothetical protein VJB35_04155 [Candidatus Nanoarchaeia archaeon]|nr:hypothetical protein [Candidatus Nanoarchaeia archaeon]
MVKILCLGNEFIEDDSLAKKVGELLKEKYDVINVNDCFQLISLLNENEDLIILDVVKGLSEVKLISVDDLQSDSILSAHDFDAGFVFKLIDKPVKIIGIPMTGNVKEICKKVEGMIEEEKFPEKMKRNFTWKEHSPFVYEDVRMQKDLELMKKVLSDNSKTYKDIGDLSEKYILIILKNIYGKDVEKIKESNNVSPDFDLKLGNESIKIENKAISPQLSFDEIVFSLSKEYPDILKSKFFDCKPCNVHLDDYERIKEKIIEVIKNNCINQEVRLKFKKKYTINIRDNKSGNGVIVGGALINPDSGIWSQISSKEKQIQKADILSIVMLNKFIYGDGLYKSFFPVTFDEQTNQNILNYSYNPWGKISHLKSVIIVYPAQKEVFYIYNPDKNISLNLKEVNKFKEGFEKQGFIFHKMDKNSYFSNEELINFLKK